MAHPFVPGSAPGQPQQPHPTVPYGQPGGPPTIVLPPNAPFPPAGQQPQVGFQQPVQPQYQQPVQPQQQQQQVPPGGSTFPPGTQPPYQPQQPMQQQQQQQQPQTTIPDNFVLDGPNVPAELRGRTFGQVRQVYSALATEFIRRPGAQPAPAPNIPGAPPQQQQQQQPQQGQQPRSFWEDPEGAVRRIVQAEVAPVQERTAQQAAQEAYQQAVRDIPDFQVLEAEMIPLLRAAPDPRLLTDVNFWKSTADLARGRMMSRGAYQPPMQQQQPQNQQRPAPFTPAPQQPQQRQPVVVGYTQQGQPIYSAPPAMPGPGNAVPAQHQFFSEAPTPPQYGTFISGNNANQWELTPEQKMYAQKMGMSEQEYRDWSGGIQRPDQTRRW